MANENFALKLLKAASEIEKRSFILKALRDAIDEKAADCRYKSFKISQNDDIEAKRPALPESFYKELPERPKLDVKNKIMKLSLFFFEAMIVCAVFSLVLLAITAKRTEMFAEPFSSAKIVGALLIVFSAATVFTLVAGISFRTLEVVKHKRNVSKWKEECERIREINNSEKERILKITLELQEKYENEVELASIKRGEDVLRLQAKAEIFELEKAKIGNCVYASERRVAQFYSEGILPTEYRRIDIVIRLAEYIENGSAEEVDDALKLYEKDRKAGIVAEHLSDIYDNPDKFRETMPCFFAELDKMLASVDLALNDAESFADEIAGKSIVNGKVQKNTLALEFQRAYDNTKLADYAGELAGMPR